MTIMDKLKILSLFSGCGGMDLGFEGGFTVSRASINENIHPDWIQEEIDEDWVRLPTTNFKTVFANDIMRAARAAWVPYFTKRGNKSSDFVLESIVDLVKTHNEGNKIFPNVDVVTGGFPCQDFSVAGKRLGFNSHKAHHGGVLNEYDEATEENRGKLYYWMKQVVEITKPKLFIAENVKGLVSLNDVKEVIQNDFRSISGNGYLVVDAKVLFAPDYGIPQTRERIIFIGFKKSALKKQALEELTQTTIKPEYNPYPKITHTDPNSLLIISNGLKPYVSVKQVFINLDEPDNSNDISQQSYSKAKWYGRHCQGQTEIDLYGLSPTIRAEHHGNIEFRRLSLEHGGKYKHELEDGLIERRLTIRECARIQTFPDDFEFVRNSKSTNDEIKISVSEGYKLIGNAVPPFLAFNLAWRIQELWPKLFKEEVNDNSR